MLRMSLILLGIMVICVAAGPALCVVQENDVTVYGSYMVAQLTEPGDTGTTEQPDATTDAGETTQPVQTEPAEPPADSTGPTVVPPADTDSPTAPAPTEPGGPAQPGVPSPTEPTTPEVTPEPEPAPAAPEPMEEETEPAAGAGPMTQPVDEPVGAGPEMETYYGEDREALPMAGTGSGWFYLSGAAVTALGIVIRRRRTVMRR